MEEGKEGTSHMSIGINASAITAKEIWLQVRLLRIGDAFDVSKVNRWMKEGSGENGLGRRTTSASTHILYAQQSVENLRLAVV